jgi:hypothetical protein
MKQTEKLASAAYIMKNAGIKEIMRALALMTASGTAGGLAGHASGRRKGLAEGTAHTKQEMFADLLAGLSPLLSETAQKGNKLRLQKTPFGQ